MPKLSIFLLEPDEVENFRPGKLNSAGQLILHWEAPRTNKGVIMRYELMLAMSEPIRNHLILRQYYPDGNATSWVVDVPFYCRNYTAFIKAFTSAGGGIQTSIHIPFILPPENFIGMLLSTHY